MKKKYQYREISTNEIVEDFMAEEYVLEKLGIKIIPKGPNGTMTKEQLDNIEETIIWFFSGNWVKEEIENEDELENDLEYQLEMADRIYQQELDRKWGLI